MDREYIKVSKEDFVSFINNYHIKYNRELIYDVYAACMPPLITYNDFSFGSWPNSVVAKTWVYDDNPNDYYYEPENKREYYINVLFLSDIAI